MMIDSLYCGKASTAVPTGITQILVDATAKNILVCVLYLQFLWHRMVYKARCPPF
jgi:hypothetical protein